MSRYWLSLSVPLQRAPFCPTAHCFKWRRACLNDATVDNIHLMCSEHLQLDIPPQTSLSAASAQNNHLELFLNSVLGPHLFSHFSASVRLMYRPVSLKSHDPELLRHMSKSTSGTKCLHKTSMFVSAGVWTEVVFRKRKKKTSWNTGKWVNLQFKCREGKADLTYDGGGGGVEGLQLDAAEAH